MSSFTKPTRALALIATAACIVPLASAGFAAQDREVTDDGSEIGQVRSAQVSLMDAAQSALDAVPGKLLDVALSDEAGASQWEIEVVKADDSIVNVFVDTATGKVDVRKADEDEGDAAGEIED